MISFFFSWSFWQWVFIVSGIIFWLLMLYGAFVWWVTDDFDGPVYEHKNFKSLSKTTNNV